MFDSRHGRVLAARDAPTARMEPGEAMTENSTAESRTDEDTQHSVPGGSSSDQGFRARVTPQGAGPSAEKDSSRWVTGDEPMTGPQASYLETLAHQAGEEVPTELSKAQAHDEIERLQGDGSDPAGDPARQERPTTEWITGDEPMTGPQASYLETLAQKAGEEPPKDLTKSQASRAIDELQTRNHG